TMALRAAILRRERGSSISAWEICSRSWSSWRMTGQQDLLRLPQPQLRDVRQALGELQRWRTRPAQGTALLREIARYGRADLAEQVLRTMQLARLQANLFHFNAALNAYRDWEEALAMCSRMLVLGLALDEFSL
ncbi:unnamed protein product, partial [Effrenium voratum]